MTLEDIAGYSAEKAEVKKIIDLLKNYGEYEKDGIYVPKGLILQGPPGCGKTLFAQAIAGECGLPFFPFSIQDEAKKTMAELKKLFKEAKERIPSIIYIDEIDKLVSTRHASSDTVRASTQLLLSELDGMTNSQGTLVIASTNFYGDLPEALTRSGRMDKKIAINAPDVESRIAIIKHYINGRKALKNISVRNLAVKLSGMSGADIKTLINNALIEAKHLDRPFEMNDFTKLIDEMEFQDIGKRWKSREAVKKILIHEAGHAVMRLKLCGSPSSISGIAYNGSAGHTTFDDDDYYEDDDDSLTLILQEDEELKSNLSKKQLTDLIACYFGGIAAEKLFYGNYDSGGISDISMAGKIFSRMCDYWFLDSRFIDLNPNVSITPAINAKLLHARARIYRKQMKVCMKILKKNKSFLCLLADKAMRNDDSLSAKQVAEANAKYEADKAGFDKKYRNWVNEDPKKGKRKDDRK